MARTPRRQHFVPRFYLRHFADPIFSSNLSVFDIKKQRWEQQRSPKGICWHPHVYSYYDLAGNRRDDFDRDMKRKVEDPAAPALKKLARNIPLSDDERSAVALFISVTGARNPAKMKRVSENYYNSLSGNDRRELDKVVAIWSESAYGLPPHVSGADLTRPILFKAIWGWSQDLQNRLLNWKWLYLTADPGEPFVTSDHPVYAERERGVHFVSFPISSQRALLISDRDLLGPSESLNPVALVNRQTIANAKEFVVASKQSFPGDDMLNQRQSP